MAALQPGTTAPSFRLPSTEGRELSLEDFRGKKVVLYFYPKDSTPGCTRESCDFRDLTPELEREGAVVLGVSKDSLTSHDRFRAKYELPFPLLSDKESQVATSFGAFGEKNMYGKKVMGTIRSTFLIDEEGRIARTWSPVKVAGHAEQVLAAVRGEEEAAPAKAATKKKADNPAAATSSARAVKGAARGAAADAAAARKGAISEKTAKGGARAAKAVSEAQAAAAGKAPQRTPQADPTGRSKLPSR